MIEDPYDLSRFAAAQDEVYARVVHELEAERKTSHWMWFVFPQIAGLGSSAMSRRYAVSGIEEARAYLAHSSLGLRLLDCAGLLSRHAGRAAIEIFGSPDDMKLQASMTLFMRAGGHGPLLQVLEMFYEGREHEETIRLLALQASRT